MFLFDAVDDSAFAADDFGEWEFVAASDVRYEAVELAVGNHPEVAVWGEPFIGTDDEVKFDRAVADFGGDVADDQVEWLWWDGFEANAAGDGGVGDVVDVAVEFGVA